MILSPIQGVSVARVTLNKQNLYGAHPELYNGIYENGRPLKFHNGLDWKVPVGTSVLAPIEGFVQVRDSGPKGYGLHVNIINDRFKIVLAHLSGVSVKDGAFIGLGEPVGLSGNSGYSTGPHLHMTVFRLKDGKILNLDNGGAGGVDVRQYIILWEGNL